MENTLIVEPHNLKSRLVAPTDYARVINEAVKILATGFKPYANFKEIYAVAHPQVTDIDPLQFFVTVNGNIIINPKIVRHTKTTVDSLEGCLSFPGRNNITVQRWNKCTVKYSELSLEGTVTEAEENLGGLPAKIFQHEMQHLGLLGEKYYIYD